MAKDSTMCNLLVVSTLGLLNTREVTQEQCAKALFVFENEGVVVRSEHTRTLAISATQENKCTVLWLTKWLQARGVSYRFVSQPA